MSNGHGGRRTGAGRKPLDPLTAKPVVAKKRTKMRAKTAERRKAPEVRSPQEPPKVYEPPFEAAFTPGPPPPMPAPTQASPAPPIAPRAALPAPAPPSQDFDALGQLELIAKVCVNNVVEELRKGAQRDDRVLAAWIDRATEACGKLAPYRHPRLTAIAVRQIKPTPYDLSSMSDEQVDALVGFLSILRGGGAAELGGGDSGAGAPPAGEAEGY